MNPSLASARARIYPIGWSLVALVVLGLVAAATPADAESPLERFVRRSLDAEGEVQDSLATSFSAAQLPLLARAVASRTDLTETQRRDAYRAFVRWHFWTGRRWDPHNRGLWTARMSPAAARSLGEDGVVAAGAALELVQLAALAQLASANGNYYDALVWWSDHAALRRRIERRLLDPATGTWADQDSLGRAQRDTGVGALLPLAAGARTVPSRARQHAWQAWTGDTPHASPDPAARMHAIEQADALNGWASEPSLRLYEPEITAPLLAKGIEHLLDPTLAPVLRDALGSVGLAVTDSVTLRLGSWTPRVSLDSMEPPVLARSWAALGFLHGSGVLPDGEAEELRAAISLSTGHPIPVEPSVLRLTEHLVTWRNDGFHEPERVWTKRRAVRGSGPNGDSGALRMQTADIAMWSGRALDRMAEDVIDYHLRPRPESNLRIDAEPELVGRGDQVELLLEASGARSSEGLPDSLRALWTDGRSVLPGPILAVESENGRQGVVRVGAAPNEIGLWSLLIEGDPRGPRRPPRAAVVEPVRMQLREARREKNHVVLRVDLVNQVQRLSDGRIEVHPPLSWDVEPNTRHDFELESLANEEIEFVLTPEAETSPAIYPIEWQLYALGRHVGTERSEVAVPLNWLRLGPLPPGGDDPLATNHGPDRSVDLADRYRVGNRLVGWTRLPPTRSSSDGWVALAGPEPREGVHFAFTGLVTSTREGTASLEADGPATLRVNGVVVAEVPPWGGRDEGEIRMGPGTNYVLVKTVSRPGRTTRFRAELRDIAGTPLRGVDNTLETLLDQYAYLTRDPDSGAEPSPRETLRLVPITYTNRAAEGVSVVGSFNGWSPTATPMTPLGEGRWQAKIRLRPGRFEYKISVDGRWIADPLNPDAVDDGFGGRNSVITVE